MVKLQQESLCAMRDWRDPCAACTAAAIYHFFPNCTFTVKPRLGTSSHPPLLFGSPRTHHSTGIWQSLQPTMTIMDLPRAGNQTPARCWPRPLVPPFFSSNMCKFKNFSFYQSDSLQTEGETSSEFLFTVIIIPLD